MKWNDLYRRIEYLLTIEDSPDILVIHCGANDIGYRVSCVFGHDMIRTVDRLRILLPKCKLVWSQILPRLKYRNEKIHKSLEKTRIRMNSMISTYILKCGGGYIRYPEISESDPALFTDDVHLSQIGNDIFTYRIQQGLYNFIKFVHSISPPNGEEGPWLRESVSI